MGLEIAALTGFLGLTGAFALVGTALAAWMAWRIVEKAGLPGWAGLGAILLTLTAVGTIVPMVLLWVFAFMRWPRDEPATAAAVQPPAAGARHVPQRTASLSPPAPALADRRPWRFTGTAAGDAVSLSVDGASSSYLLTGASAARPTDLSVPDPSVGQPHARLLSAGGRLGLEDLGVPSGTFIDGAQLLPEHGPRDITGARIIRLGNVELALTRT